MIPLRPAAISLRSPAGACGRAPNLARSKLAEHVGPAFGSHRVLSSLTSRGRPPDAFATRRAPRPPSPPAPPPHARQGLRPRSTRPWPPSPCCLSTLAYAAVKRARVSARRTRCLTPAQQGAAELAATRCGARRRRSSPATMRSVPLVGALLAEQNDEWTAPPLTTWAWISSLPAAAGDKHPDPRSGLGARTRKVQPRNVRGKRAGPVRTFNWHESGTFLRTPDLAATEAAHCWLAGRMRLAACAGDFPRPPRLPALPELVALLALLALPALRSRPRRRRSGCCWGTRLASRPACP